VTRTKHIARVLGAVAVPLVLIFGAFLVAAACTSAPSRAPAATGPTTVAGGSVTATGETAPVPHGGDAADDPAIWVNEAAPARSTIIGTDKQGGLVVYDLAGKQLQYLPDGQMNNVDLRAGFPLSGKTVTLVTAGDRSDNTIAMYAVNPATGELVDVAARPVVTGSAVYGSCMYRSAKTGKFYYFVNQKDGGFTQWELIRAGARVDAKRVRAFTVGSQPEGCVADDGTGALYVGEEEVAVWRFGAEPDAGDARTQVDRVGGNLAADIEGMSIAYGKGDAGYLFVSSQGSNSYAVYDRGGSNAFVRSFTIVAGNGIDGTSATDGVAVTTKPLGSAFPHGVFVAQDDADDGGTQNFKLVPLQSIVPRA
jgi:3-phytase